ncbi:MAG TPA: hypothetical protein VE910_05860, partial [Dongiaceae bacterium]|nr:hypothetical protein [Dongiaceae bacterium]
MQDTVVQRLLEAKLVNPQQIADAERLQKTGGGSVSSNLVKLGAIAEKEFNDFLSKFYGVPFIDIAAQDVDPAVVRLIPADVANKFQVVPLKRNGRHLTVVMANPSNIFAIDDIKFITGCEVETRV